MSKSRVASSLETWSPEDKSFHKSILEPGYGDATANEGSVCIVNVSLVDPLEISDEDLGPYRFKVDTEVTIGQGDTYLSELLDRIVASMKEGERCYVKCRVNLAGVKVDEMDNRAMSECPKFHVTLKSLNRSADIEDLEVDERLERAEQHKARGVELYAANNVAFAVRRFQRALDYLKQIDDKPTGGDSSVVERAVAIRCQCELNLAACRLKTMEFQRVIDHCTTALTVDPANVKGLFRRAQALVKLERHAEARTDLELARRLEPNNRAVAEQLRTVDRLIHDEKLRERTLYQRMFV